VLGLVAWLAFVASAPTYSYGADEDMGSNAYYWILLGVALGAGLLLPQEAPVIGALLSLPGLLLSPWTAPRGDNDGLWILIVPILAIFTALLVGVACVGRWLRTRASTVARNDVP
jgi:hypothetical protein